jgi:hypothetical protein
MPQPPGEVELEATSILCGVDHEHPARADHQVVEVGPAAGDGKVVPDGPPLPLQRGQQPGGAPLGDGVGQELVGAVVQVGQDGL